MKKPSKKELEENYRARIESESYHELTPEQEKRGEENRRKLAQFMKKKREQNEQEAH